MFDYSDVEGWLADCPSWCEGIQCKSEFPADRYHQSVIVSFPAIALSTLHEPMTGALRHDVDSTDVDLVIRQRHPDDYLWVSLSAENDTIEISLESARSLHRSLGGLLALMAHPEL